MTEEPEKKWWERRRGPGWDYPFDWGGFVVIAVAFSLYVAVKWLFPGAPFYVPGAVLLAAAFIGFVYRLFTFRE